MPGTFLRLAGSHKLFGDMFVVKTELSQASPPVSVRVYLRRVAQRTSLALPEFRIDETGAFKRASRVSSQTPVLPRK